MKKILIIEDEKNLGLSLKEYISDIGFQCFLASSLKEARSFLKKEVESNILILLDIGLPDGNGLEFARQELKNQNYPIIFLSAQNDPDIRVQGLELGAIDYITKPFNLKELTIKINRFVQNAKTKFEIGNIIFDYEQMSIIINEEETSLTIKENLILKLFFENLNYPVERSKMIEDIWGEDKYPTERTIDNYIVKLRKLFEPSNLSIQSVRGVGYKLFQGENN